MVYLCLVVWLAVGSFRFGYNFEVSDMPVLWFTGGLVFAGALYFVLPRLISEAAQQIPTLAKSLFWFMIVCGLAMRLALFASEPVLEDDYQRYLWDGAVSAHGFNPYAVKPEAASTSTDILLRSLAEASGVIIWRINHPDLRTIYPPVAQGAFAVAHIIKPWSLMSWRGLCLVFDLMTLGLLILLLGEVGRSPLWVALYWWNPVVLKELFNSAHMEAVLLPLVLGALYLAIKKRFLLSSTALAFGVGVKLWPVLLLPVLLRPLLSQPLKLIAPLAVFAGLCLVFALPVLLAGLDGSSGFVAYAKAWNTNNAFFPVLKNTFDIAIQSVGLKELDGGILARALLVAFVLAVTGWQSMLPITGAEDLIKRAAFVVAALFLVSPAQFPWYYIWVVPFLVFFPVRGLLVLSVTMPLYYSAFHFLARDSYETFTGVMVWIIWVPVWALLMFDLLPVIWRGRLEGSAR